MKRFFVALFVVCATLFAQAPPTPSNRITDKTGTLSQPVVAQLNRQLEALEKKNGSQILVYMDFTLNGVPIEDFGIKAARAWHPGQAGNNNGAILFIFKNDRKMRIEVGRGLEASMTDTKTRSILDDIIRPKFKAGNYDSGIQGGLEAMIKIASGGTSK